VDVVAIARQDGIEGDAVGLVVVNDQDLGVHAESIKERAGRHRECEGEGRDSGSEP